MILMMVNDGCLMTLENLEIITQPHHSLITFSEAVMAEVLVIAPSLARVSRIFSRLTERSRTASLSLDEESPLSVLSARASPAVLDLSWSLGLVDDMLGLGGTELGAA